MIRARQPAPTNEPRWQVAGMDVQVRRSQRRRTLALQVRGGLVTAYAPLGLPDATILGFVEAKQDWLRQHVQQQRRRPQAPVLGDGSALAFLGETLTLRLAPVPQVRREGQTLLVPQDAPNQDGAAIAALVGAWTREAVLPTYTALVQHYAGRLGAASRLGRVQVSATRTRWGSCTAAGDIRLHWALSRAPLPVLHYVALHEAAHLLELNHSPRYWRHVARIMPEHEQWRDWLRQHGEELGIGAQG